MTPEELRKLAKEQHDAAGAILGKATEEKRDLTEDEDTAIQTHYTEEDKLLKRAQTIEDHEKRSALYGQPAEAPVQIPVGGERQSVEVVNERAYPDMGLFLQDVRAASIPGNCPVATLERINKHDQELRAALGNEEGVPSEGGFLISPQHSSELLKRTFTTGKLASKTKRIPIGADKNSLSYPMVDESSRADGSRQGGVRGYWSSEAEAMTSSKTKFKAGRLDLDKITVLTYATDELLQDATALEAWYSDAVPDEIGFKIDDALLNGTGAGQPLGILNSNALVSVAKESGQDAATILAENIEKMYARALDPAKCEWYINQACWTQIFQLHHAIGTGGVPLFVPGGGLSQAPYDTLFGRPIVPLEQCQALGTKGDIYFADFSKYLVIDKGSTEHASSIHVQFTTNETAFRWIYRANGQPLRNSALTPFKGADTLSDYIALSNRS